MGLIKRLDKGSPLTYAEMDANLEELDNRLGVNQTWQKAEFTDTGATFIDGTPKFRKSGVIYTNTSSKPIQVNIGSATSTNHHIYVDGVEIGINNSGNVSTPWNFIVPAGSTYQFSDSLTTIINYWSEIR